MAATVRIDEKLDDWAAGNRERMEAAGSTDVRSFMAFVDGSRYSVLVSRDPIASLPSDPSEVCDYRWHVSVAGESNVPRWSHLVAIGHEVRPGVCFCVGVPPRSHWMSVHPHCLHLWELRDENLTDQWMAERTGAVPS